MHARYVADFLPLDHVPDGDRVRAQPRIRHLARPGEVEQGDELGLRGDAQVGRLLARVHRPHGGEPLMRADVPLVHQVFAVGAELGVVGDRDLAPQRGARGLAGAEVVDLPGRGFFLVIAQGHEHAGGRGIKHALAAGDVQVGRSVRRQRGRDGRGVGFDAPGRRGRGRGFLPGSLRVRGRGDEHGREHGGAPQPSWSHHGRISIEEGVRETPDCPATAARSPAGRPGSC